MQYKQIEDTYMIYIEKDEPVVTAITQFCIDHKIKNAQISGIGAVKEIALGAYDLDTKSYVKQTFPDVHELISFQGNITLKEGKPFIHSHIIIGNHGLELKGGHLFEMKVAIVGEFIVRKINSSIRREIDQDIGLATWCLLD